MTDTDLPREVVNINPSDTPEAAALEGIIRGLLLAQRGVPGVNPAALIKEGARSSARFGRQIGWSGRRPGFPLRAGSMHGVCGGATGKMAGGVMWCTMELQGEKGPRK